MRIISRFLREYTSGWLRFSRLGLSARETEGKTVFSESLTSPSLGPRLCLWASAWVWQVNQCGEGLCSTGLESRWWVLHSQWSWELRESQHGAICEHLSQWSRPWGGHDRDSCGLDLRMFPPPSGAPHHFLLPQFVLHWEEQLLWPWFPGGSSCSAEHKGWVHGGGVCLEPWHVWSQWGFCAQKSHVGTPPWWV